MLFYIVIGILLIIFVYILILYNTFVRLNNKVDEAFSTMDVYLKKRWDIIPNIVETVKSYAKYEKDTFENVIQLRNNYDNLSDEEKIKINESLSNNVNKIMILVESYPDLKANENFKNLSNQLVKIEDDIANARKYYNGTVRIYNNKVEMFPNNIFAKLFGYKSKLMFMATVNERKNIEINL